MNGSRRKPDFSRSFRFLRLATVVMLGFVSPLLAQTRGFISIDAPGAGTLLNQGTTAIAINQSGAVAGYYDDDTYAYHGFVRSADGVITEFDAPGLSNTEALAMNGSGQIAGYGLHDFSIRGEYLGFLRQPNGSISGFQPPGALATFPSGINDGGEIAGWYYTGNNVYHSFIAMTGSGAITYTLFDEPDARIQPGYGTFATGINAKGVVVGYYVDATAGTIYGYTRDIKGNFTSFRALEAGTGPDYGTIPLAINTSGEIVGYYSDSSGVLHGFFRDALGNITAVDPSGSIQTFAYSINDKGETVGYWVDSNQLSHGFLREPSGKITSFSAPVADNNGTMVLNINNARQMTGFYYDFNGASHGFLWQAVAAEAAK